MEFITLLHHLWLSSRDGNFMLNFITPMLQLWTSSNRKGFGVFRVRGRVLEGFWHVAWGGSRPLRRGRCVRGPRRGASGGVEVPFEGQAAVLRSLVTCKV